MQIINYQVEAFWDEEAKTWVATSENIIGLVTEADTLENLTQKLRLIIPELLLLNQQDSLKVFSCSTTSSP